MTQKQERQSTPSLGLMTAEEHLAKANELEKSPREDLRSLAQHHRNLAKVGAARKSAASSEAPPSSVRLGADTSANSEEVLKHLRETLAIEPDPGRRARLMLHIDRFETLKRLSNRRQNASSPSQAQIRSDVNQLAPPISVSIQAPPAGLIRLLLGLIGLFAPVKFTAEAHIITELKRNGVDPERIPAQIIRQLANHAVTLSITPHGIDRFLLATNVATVARDYASTMR